MWRLYEFLLLYLSAELLSLLSCLWIVVKLKRHRVDCVQTTSVFWILFCFFACLGASYGCSVLYTLELLLDVDLRAEFGVYVLFMVLNESLVTRWYVMLVLFLDDITFIGLSLWFLAMGQELAVLADRTMDRGAKRERIIIRRYLLGVHTIVAGFACLAIVLMYRQGGYTSGNVVTYTGYYLTMSGAVHFVVRLAVLRWKRRHLETVQGQFVLSPLYVRVRNFMVVFAAISLLSTFGPPTHDDWQIILAAVIYRLSGLMLALLVGCSQEMIVGICGKCLPQDYVAQFTTPTLISYVEKLDAPRQNPVFVFTDIESSTALWALENGAIMQQANELHEDILRSLLLQYNGYEITTAGDAFQLAFHCIEHAVKYCVEAQFQLLHAKWPKQLRNCGVASAARERVHGKTILEGLRVRMGIHDAQEGLEGSLVCSDHPVTGKKTYTGLSQEIAGKVSGLGLGGQIVMTARVAQWVEANQERMEVPCYAEFLGSYVLTSLKETIQLYQLVINELAFRLQVFRDALPRELESCRRLDGAFDEVVESVSRSADGSIILEQSAISIDGIHEVGRRSESKQEPHQRTNVEAEAFSQSPETPVGLFGTTEYVAL